MTTQPHNEILAAHALATLPDSISKRKNLLTAIAGSLPRGNEFRTAAQLLLRTLECHEAAQRDLFQ
jgi:hypothetical protein